MHKQRPAMSDLDIQLIKEFALRPIIYNKATPFFKNKYLTDCAWDEIAAKVRGDVVRVRDRINQLRNRYNLEKRKVDIQKTEGYSNARSTWPLFENLRFLDGHIRPRKSYKCMVRRPRPVGRPRRNHKHHRHQNHSDDSFVAYNDDARSLQYTNPIALQHQQQQMQQQQGVRIKHEQPDSGVLHPNDTDAMYQSGYESDGDGDCTYLETSRNHNDQRSNSDGEHFINPATFLVENEESAGERRITQIEAIGRDTHNNLSTSAPSQNARTIALNSQKTNSINLTLRNLNTMKDQQAATNGERSLKQTNTSTIAIDSESQSSMLNYSYHRNRSKHSRSPIAKFDAFGSFVASSIADLPQQNALELVEKFTSELVRALIAATKPKE